MAKKLCAACGKEFTPRPQIRNQSFCSAPECQRERHRQWQKRKRQTMRSTERSMQSTAAHGQQKMLATGSDIAKNHPDYADRNRQLQKQRNAKSQKLKP
jgi:23S rRNA G2445 N2-methylase RlmL